MGGEGGRRGTQVARPGEAGWAGTGLRPAPCPGADGGGRAGPGPAFQAQVSASRGGAGSRGSAEASANHRRTGTPNRQSRPGSVAPAPPCPLFPVTLAALGAAPTAGSRPPALWLPARADRLVCTRPCTRCGHARVHGPPLPVPGHLGPATRHRPVHDLAHSSALSCLGTPEGLAQAFSRKALLRG